MYALQKSNKKTSSRNQIDIRGVKNGILSLSHYRYRVALSVSPMNFELKNEDEQDAIITIYESFLNSVGCPLEILIRTRKIDMDDYIAELKGQAENEQMPIYRSQLNDYSEFIRGLITTNKILTRHFYVIVPYDATSNVDFESIREQLGNRVEIVRKGLVRLGLQSRELGDLELLDLFYTFYSPEQAKIQPLTQQALDLLYTGYIRKAVNNE